jgi:hypothetical protein
MTISRERVLLRAKYGWPTETVPFNKATFHAPDGYRTDAAGFACMCWDIPLHVPHSWGGLSTVTLETDGWVKEIPVRDLLPGDAIGHCGPGSTDSDGGSVVIFEGWLNGDMNLGYALVWQQLPDVSPGPARRGRPIDFRRWHGYRFKDIVD